MEEDRCRPRRTPVDGRPAAAGTSTGGQAPAPSAGRRERRRRVPIGARAPRSRRRASTRLRPAVARREPCGPTFGISAVTVARRAVTLSGRASHLSIDDGTVPRRAARLENYSVAMTRRVVRPGIYAVRLAAAAIHVLRREVCPPRHEPAFSRRRPAVLRRAVAVAGRSVSVHGWRARLAGCGARLAGCAPAVAGARSRVQRHTS